MAKRIIQECDLTKQEYDPDETVTLVFKKKGKTNGRTYELSPSAAAKLEQQLVAGKEAVLEEGWSFTKSSGGRTPRPMEDNPVRTLGDLENEEQIIANKKAELREAGVLEQEAPAEQVFDGVIETPKNDNGCRHINKGRILTTLKGGKRFAYRTCKDCRTQIPEMTVEERQAFMNGKTDPDVNARELIS